MEGRMKYRLRDANEDDLVKIYEIERLSFKNPYGYDLLWWLLKAQNCFFIVAETDNEIIGYLIGRYEREHIFSKLKRGHIVSIAVHPKWRRKGVGTALMLEAIRRFREANCTRVILEVRVSNKPAIQLYEKLGFRRIKRIKGYYIDGEDAWVYELPLKEREKPND